MGGGKTIMICLLILLYFCEEGQGAISIKFRGGNSRFSPKYFSNFTLFTKDDGIFVDMMVVKPLQAGFKANLEFQLRLNNSNSYQKLFGYRLDVCSVVTAFKDTIFKKWFNSLLKYGNFMQNCPVAKGHYYLNGWKLEPSLAPPFLYPGDYRLKGYGFMGRFNTKNEDFVLELDVDCKIS